MSRKKGETLTHIELKIYRTAYTGKQEHFYTIALEDAIVVDINALNTEEGVFENVNFVYRKITLRHETASTSSSDDIRTGADV